MTVKIIARISKKNYKALKKLAKYKGTDRVVNQALKQFFNKNHKITEKQLLKFAILGLKKRGYKEESLLEV